MLGLNEWHYLLTKKRWQNFKKLKVRSLHSTLQFGTSCTAKKNRFKAPYYNPRVWCHYCEYKSLRILINEGFREAVTLKKITQTTSISRVIIWSGRSLKLDITQLQELGMALFSAQGMILGQR